MKADNYITTLLIPRTLAARLDRLAGELATSRSALLRRAAVELLRKQERETRNPEGYTSIT